MRASALPTDLRVVLARPFIEIATLAIDLPARRGPFHSYATIAADRRVAPVTDRSRIRIAVMIAEEAPNTTHRKARFLIP